MLSEDQETCGTHIHSWGFTLGPCLAAVPGNTVSEVMASAAYPEI